MEYKDGMGSWRMQRDLTSLAALDSYDIARFDLKDIGKAIEILAKAAQRIEDRQRRDAW